MDTIFHRELEPFLQKLCIVFITNTSPDEVVHAGAVGAHYKGTSLIRNTPPPQFYSRTIPRVLRWSYSVGGLVASYERGTPVQVFV